MLDWKEDEHNEPHNGYTLHADVDFKTHYDILCTPHAGMVYLTVRVMIGNNDDSIEQAKVLAEKIDGIFPPEVTITEHETN